MIEYRKGDVVEYRRFGGRLRHVLVTSKRKNIKDGRPGFQGPILWDEEDGTPVPDESVESWGYDEQITRVVETKEERRGRSS